MALLVKRERSRSPPRAPARLKPEPKSSSEILSELFGAFNAAPPDLRDLSDLPRPTPPSSSTPSLSPSPVPSPAPPARSSRSKKKLKKEKKEKKHKKNKKRPRRSRSSSADSSVCSKRHKRKKKKLKKEKERRRTSPSPEPPPPPLPVSVKLKRELDDTDRKTKVKVEGMSEAKISRVSNHEDNKNFMVTIKNEDPSNIPMPLSPNREPKLSSNDLRRALETKHSADKDNDAEKSKNKIQIKNLKFSAVFEETVKKAEEEARLKAEKYEDGELFSDSSSECSTDQRRADPDDVNKEFPKSADPGGILLKKSEDKKRDDRERDKSRSDKQRHSEHSSSHKSSRRRSRSRSRRRSRSRHHSRSRERNKTSSRRERSTSRSRTYSRRDVRLRLGRRSRSPGGVRLADTEKRRLLEVARRNAINMLKNGAVPAAAAALPPHTRLQVMAAIQSGGKSVDELTDFCKHLSKKEALGELSSVSEDSDISENEDTLAFHHPFLVKDRAPIVMNIRGGAPLPVKSGPLAIINKEELRLQFPVSSGTQHRVGEHEWRPVTPPVTGAHQIAKLSHKHPPKSTPATNSSAVIIIDDPRPAPTPSTPAPTTLDAPTAILMPPPPMPVEPPTYMKGSFTTGNALATVSSPALQAPGPQVYPPGMEPQPSRTVDVSSIVSQKLFAIRQQAERNDFIPASGFGGGNRVGLFTGSTGANILSQRELASGSQAWAKKDQLVRAAPVHGGMGMHLLQKMGWTPGRGLGKEESGTLQPLMLEVKLDTKGLQAREEKKPQRNNRPRSTASGLATLAQGVSGKHPVSLLGEYCSKRKLGPPEYTLCFEAGPDHKKNFLFKVKVAGVEYQPAVASVNKKQAKADSAQLALQKLGILP